MAMTCKLPKQSHITIKCPCSNREDRQEKNELNGLKNGLTVYSSMGTISTATLFLCLIDLDMWYVKCINIQTFHLNNKQIKFTNIRQDIHEVKKQTLE
jgi:hypothetical protein